MFLINIDMKKVVVTYLLILISFSTLLSQVEIYPVMPGVNLNPDFSVRVDDGSGFQEVPVQDIVDACFVHFAMTGSVKIEISIEQPIDYWKISPERLGIIPVVVENTMTFSIDKPEKLIVLINEGAGNHLTGLDGLCILAEIPEINVPLLSDPDVVNIMDFNVDSTGNILATTIIQQVFDDYNGKGKTIYFPAGVYKSGMLHMRNDQSLYLAPGAVLMGSSNYDDYPQIPGEGNAREKYMIGSWKTNNIKIFGRGIINGNGTALRLQDPTGEGFKTHNIQFQGSRNVAIEGIISLDAGSWSIEPIACDSVIIRNVKVISDLRLYGSKINTDGIDPNKCRHVLVEDCLIWCGDDAITPKQDNAFNIDFPLRNVFNHTYRNIIAYTPKSAIKIGSETWGPGREMYNMTFENFDVVYADRAICIWSEEGAIINYMTFKDFNIEKISDEYKKSHIHCWINKNGNSIRNLKFINIHAKEPAPGGSSFIGDNLNATIGEKKVQYYNIHFSNYTIAGEPVLSLSDPNAKFNLRENFTTYADSSAFTFDAGVINGIHDVVGQKNSNYLMKLKVFPNPFSDAFHIDFILEKNEHVKIIIRNISGQIVKTILDNQLMEGSHSLKWNSELERSGLYLVSVWTEEYQHTVRVYKM